MILDKLIHKNSSMLTTAVVAAVIVFIANGIPYFIKKYHESQSLDSLLMKMDFSEKNVRPRIELFVHEKLTPAVRDQFGIEPVKEEQDFAVQTALDVLSPQLIRNIFKARVLDFAKQKGWDDGTLRKKLVKADPAEIEELKQITPGFLRNESVRLAKTHLYLRLVPYWTNRHPEFKDLIPPACPQTEAELPDFIAARLRCRIVTGMLTAQKPAEADRIAALEQYKKLLTAENARKLVKYMIAALKLTPDELWLMSLDFPLEEARRKQVDQWIDANSGKCLTK